MDKVAAAREPPKERRRVRAAQYVRMSTEHQTYSLENQKDAIRSYAEVMAYDIVATYEDPGRSGLHIQGRPGLKKLLFDIEHGLADYETVVVYDVSRWGRFQSVDESASYEYRCQMAGVRIEFCAEQFANDGTVGSDVLKAIKRSMAAEYSRMLSQRVFLGQVRMARMGFHVGGMQGLGLRRLMVDQFGQPKLILARYEHKNFQTDRVIIVPGPPEEIATVRLIFRLFVRSRKNEPQIAKYLNARGILNDFGRPWKAYGVRRVLTNEKYIGNNVWNRRCTKLKTKAVYNPPDQWVRADNAFEPIISRELFDKAQQMLKALYLHMSDDEMLSALRKLYKRHGKLSSDIINAAPGCPSAYRYSAHFGGLLGAYKLIGCLPPRKFHFIEIDRRLTAIRHRVMEDLLVAVDKAGGRASQAPETELIRINGEVTVALAIARCRVSHCAYPRWSSRAVREAMADIFVLIRMQPGNLIIRDYLIAPMHEIVGFKGDFHVNNGMKLDAFLFRSLDPLVALAERAFVGNAA
ncbi:recombinase family protein [Mesorhizobium sp. B2-4-13]|uniref:recombinase family protein n=1 Tax=Mesorhizobium sp. B2-4-13 TaxID=2589936 RepID=UPI00115240A9|nr:recombinase family protein [Mesorhizobium sp. B2-4-13]TPK86568.1 recombinase family protein [Mesorhizobium sp. B2-4-13]